MAAFLVPLETGACVIPLEKAILLIGRQADCDVSLTASRKISRKHCCIAIVNEAVVVRDLGSTNGISINGQRIEQEGRLRLGDELSIGDVRFRLQKDAQLAGTAAPTPESIPNRRVSGDAPRPRTTMPDNYPPPSLDFPVALGENGENFAPPPVFPSAKAGSATKPGATNDSGPLVPFLSEDDFDALPLPSDSI